MLQSHALRIKECWGDLSEDDDQDVCPTLGEYEVYVDDMLVKSWTAEQHEGNLSEAFWVMRSHGMKLNLAKCSFGVRSNKFLDFIVHQ